MSDQMVIRLYWDSNICITTEEYEELVREIEIKQMLYYVSHRYHEILHRRAVAEGRFTSAGE
jgi:hypothetical protein